MLMLVVKPKDYKTRYLYKCVSPDIKFHVSYFVFFGTVTEVASDTFGDTQQKYCTLCSEY
jgi:hypothetical protein